MRLFVALTPPDRALDEVESLAGPYRSSYPRLRWAGRDRWHVTLSFLGEVGDDRLELLRPRLDAAAAQHCPLELSFAGAGAFPRAARARVLWLGLAGDSAALADLAASVSSAARESGIPQEKRTFSAHLTLARCREPADVRPLVQALSPFAGSTWTAGAIHLVRSHLGPQPRYETIESWWLAAGAPAASAESGNPDGTRDT